MKATAEALERERSKIADVYRRREIGIEKDFYAPWQPAVNWMVAERKRVAAAMLHKMGKFPQRGDKCLEIGCGRLGWLADLLSWGMREKDLHGIELDADRVLFAQQALPNSHLRIGDVAELPWPEQLLRPCHIIHGSLVGSGQRCSGYNRQRNTAAFYLAAAPCSGIISPSTIQENPDVHGISSIELKRLFPDFQSRPDRSRWPHP